MSTKITFDEAIKALGKAQGTAILAKLIPAIVEEGNKLAASAATSAGATSVIAPLTSENVTAIFAEAYSEK